MTKITELPDASLPLDDTDLIEVVQGVGATPMSTKVAVSELSGGGGGGGAPVDDLAQWSGVIESEEFLTDGTDLPDGWSWGSQGGASFSSAFSIGALTVPQETTWRYIVKSLASLASFTLTTKMSVQARTGGIGAGLMLRDTTTGRLCFVGWAGDSENFVVMQRWSNGTTWNSTGASMNLKLAGSILYLRIRKVSSTEWYFDVSHDGVAWYTLNSSAIDLSTFMTPDEYGYGVWSRDAGTVALGCDFVRLQ